MPRVLANITVQKGEVKEFISQEGVKFTIENNSAGFKKVRLAFVYSQGRKAKNAPAEQHLDPPKEKLDANGT